MTKVCAAQLAHQAARKRAYRARIRDGLAVFRVTADALDIAELLAEAGVLVGVNADAEALGAGLSDLVRLWQEGRIGLLCPQVDIPDEDDAV
jgi:hypothetical protein